MTHPLQPSVPEPPLESPIVQPNLAALIRARLAISAPNPGLLIGPLGSDAGKAPHGDCSHRESVPGALGSWMAYYAQRCASPTAAGEAGAAHRECPSFHRVPSRKRGRRLGGGAVFELFCDLFIAALDVTVDVVAQVVVLVMIEDVLAKGGNVTKKS